MSEQLTLAQDVARREAERGMTRALEKAEWDVPKWGDIALAYLKRYAENNQDFAGYFVTMDADRDPLFPQPENDRAWGMVWRRAAKLGYVRDSGRTVPHPKRHGCKAIVWQSLIFRRPA